MAFRSGMVLSERSLGHCDWSSDNSLGGLGALEGCPQKETTVVFNQDSIPPWILWAVGGWMLWMALKDNRR